jgi:eukaryotic-like serine/threonine-protein kinase
MSEGEEKKVIADRYEVIRSLGRGGMGEVLLVRDLECGEKRAMKLIRQEWQEKRRVVTRFHREVKALQQLRHPCIVKIHDAGNYKNQLYYTMEYVRGKSVRRWIAQRGPLHLGSVVRVLCLVAHALEHAHQVTIHRDISPENVMVMGDGSIRLLDFGLAKLNDVEPGLTIAGRNLGKLKYNAPEQQINAADVDARADIYSLGIMFYEMLTGELPDYQRRITDIRPELPRGCDHFFNRAAARNPEDRFPTAREFRKTLMDLYHDFEKGGSGILEAAAPEAAEARGNGSGRAWLWRWMAALNPFRWIRRKTE